MGRLSRIANELRRRNVFRTAIAYFVFAWLFIQVADILLPLFDAPTWVMRLLVVVLAIGFPSSLIFAWVFEITPSGVFLTENVPIEQSITDVTGRRLDFIIIGVLVAALAASLYANFRDDPVPESLPGPVSILVADFANNTGNDIYTDVLEDTLRIGVEVAPFIETFSRDDARLVAREFLAEQGSEVGLDSETAVIVAIRQGVDIVVGGRIDKVKNQIAITVYGARVSDQEQVFEISESATNDNEILTTVAELARKLRLALGDYERPDYRGDQESFTAANIEAAAEYMKAHRLHYDQEYEAAIASYTIALELDPNLVRAHVGRALSMTFLGMTAEAANDWAAVIPKLDQLSERARLRTLSIYYASVAKDWQNALDTAQRLVERYPADSAGHNNLAVAAFYNLDFDRARETGINVAERYPGNTLYKLNLAAYSMYAGEFQESAALANELVTNGESPFAYVVAALSSLAIGARTYAEALYEEMRELGFLGQSLSFEGMADLEMNDGNFRAAIDILDAGVSADLDQNAGEGAAIKYTMLAESFIGLGDWNMAKAHLENAIDIASGDASLVGAALLSVKIGEFERAESIADDLADDLSKIHRSYAAIIRSEIAQANGDGVHAIDLGKSAIEFADLWLARFTLGNVYLSGGYFVEAFGEFQVCKDRIGESLSVYLNDRPTFRMTGKLDSSIEATDTSLRATLDQRKDVLF